MTAAEVIRRYRFEHNEIDQASFGKLIGVSQSTVSMWESGESIKRDNCAALAKLTGMPIMIFLTAGMKQEEAV